MYTKAGALIVLMLGATQAIDVSRPADWGGLTFPGKKPIESNMKRVHGAVGVSLVKLPESLEGHDSYRVWMHINKGQNSKNIYTIFGDSNAPLKLSTENSDDKFYHVDPPFGADIGGVDDQLWVIKPEAQFDSWITVGADSGNDGNKLSIIGIDGFDADGIFTTDGALFSMNPDDVPAPRQAAPAALTALLGEQERDWADAALVAQLTVPAGAAFTGHFNAQGRSVTGPDWQEHGICFSTKADACTTHQAPQEL